MNRYDDDIPLTDNNYDGVVYEPSQESESLDDTHDYVKNPHREGSGFQRDASSSPKEHRAAPSKPRAYPSRGTRPQSGQNQRNQASSSGHGQKSYYKTLMLITIISGIIICAVAFVVVYKSISSNPQSIPKTAKADDVLQGKEITESIENSKIGSTVTGVITAVDINSGIFTLLSFDENRNYVLKSTTTTELRNTYNGIMSLAEFKVGNIVDFIYDKDKNLTSLKLSNSGWSQEGITGVSVNTDNRTVSFGNKTYSYSELLTSTFKGEVCDADKVDPMDKVTITGYNNTVYSINIEKGHGILQLKNKDKIKDGTFEVDKDVYKKLTEIGSVTVSEGTHRIIVKGANCDTFTRDVSVEADQTADVDLSEVNIKTGILLIKSNVSDYILTINNTPELSREPLVLEYGAYNIKLEKEGYKSYETQLILDTDQKTVNANLESIVKTSKVTLNSTPSGAEVYIDNAKVGYTPVTVEIAQGKHNVTVNKDGYTEVTYSGIDINDTEYVFNITLLEKVSTPDVADTSASAQSSGDTSGDTQASDTSGAASQ